MGTGRVPSKLHLCVSVAHNRIPSHSVTSGKWHAHHAEHTPKCWKQATGWHKKPTDKTSDDVTPLQFKPPSPVTAEQCFGMQTAG